MTWSRRLFFVFAAFVVLTLINPKPIFARSWSYGITDADTPVVIDCEVSNADIDTVKNEIRLPLMPMSNVVQFSPDGSYSYAVLTEIGGVKVFQFDGNKMTENPLVSIDVADSLSMALPYPMPDVVVATEEGIAHYSFTGVGMVETPALSIAGLTGIMAVGSNESGSLSVLTETEIKRYLFDGSSLVEAPFLGFTLTEKNPLGMAISKGYDFAILLEDAVKYYSFDGTGMVENPLLTVTGLNSPVAFIVTETGDMAIVEDTKVRHLSFDGTRMVYNVSLSVTQGLTQPAAIAIRPGTHDRLIVDGDEVRYYSFDGQGLVYNPYLSTVVEGIAKGTSYRKTAEVQSLGQDINGQADMVRVRANLALPVDTSITWSVTADGENWVTGWRGQGLETGTVLEISPDNGHTWVEIGSASDAGITSNRKELWTDVEPGSTVKWKAELTTTNRKLTPIISGLLGMAVKWEANARPKPPPIIMPEDGWYYTTTPTFYWEFVDTDEGDYQSAFQLEVRRQSDDALVYDTGKIMGSETSFILPTSTRPDVPGPLWLSGDYAFYVQARTWDMYDAESEWSVPGYFKILAFERPRIAEIINPPIGQEAPTLDNPVGHQMVLPGMVASTLPKIKAGARVIVLLDSVGPITDEATAISTFPYLDAMSTIDSAERFYSSGNSINRWRISFYTEASLAEVPAGTVVEMQVQGTGTEGGNTVFLCPPYAEGVAITEGSIYEDWFVVLQGSDS